MHKLLLRLLTSWYKTLSRRIFIKLILLIVVPNLLLLVIINQLMNKQITQKVEEMDNTLNVLEHATNRELRAMFNDVTTLTNQILIEPDVQRILSGRSVQSPAYDMPSGVAATENNMALRVNYANQDVIRSVLSRYRLVWNNIYSISLISSSGDIYVNTSENYTITAGDVNGSLLLRDVALQGQRGLAWSVNDALTKNADMITIARKIYSVNDPKQVIGYVLVNMSLNAVRGSFDTYNYYGQMLFGLTNRAESVWMVYAGKKMAGGNGRILPSPAEGLQESFSEIPLNGKMWRTVVMPLEDQGYLFVGLDTEYIANQSAQFRKNLYFGYVFFLGLAALISLVGTNVLYRRLSKLNHAMRALGQKKWGTRIVLNGTDELNVIGSTFNSMADQIEYLMDDLKEQQRLKRLFELRVLEYQINPHFLYNTLDSINWLALENNQTQISEMVNGLSKLFKIILSKGKEIIKLHEEFDMVRIYLNIQKNRFDDRFIYSIELEPEIADYPISKLVLQPIVENAIVHGIRRSRVQGVIRVSGRREGEKVVLEIADNGVGMSQEQVRAQLELLGSPVLDNAVVSPTGYGMKNVDSRLKLLFGADYAMQLEPAAEETLLQPRGTKVRIVIIEKAMQERDSQ